MEKIIIPNWDASSWNLEAVPNSARVELTVPKAGEVSDGYHTFDELYDHRITLFIALCRLGSDMDNPPNASLNPWRAKLHHDGTLFEGWFIMGIGKEKGAQISYHLPVSYWGDTNFAETLERAPEWDGHTSDDVIKRLNLL